MKKYLCVGDYVRSLDGDEHFIPSYRLVELYGLNRNDCILIDSRRKEDELKIRGLEFEKIYYPRSDGNYTP